MLVGFFCSSPVATGIDGGGTISSYAGCSYASQRHLQSTRSRLPRQFELAGEFLFQDVAPVCDQLLWRLKAAPVLDLSVIVG
jgi:hypothetical protein